ncbi:hypothetical protein NCCNTM_41780 [Mycolicibacterium sp. NCC-Tsukiji]|nr:hypothetical protein NCCNTM_41780 [Mycolicibacterium sp. NCC-Tsukiji]
MASGTQSELAVGGLAWLTTGRGVNGEYALVLIASAKHALTFPRDRGGISYKE